MAKARIQFIQKSIQNAIFRGGALPGLPIFSDGGKKIRVRAIFPDLKDVDKVKKSLERIAKTYGIETIVLEIQVGGEVLRG